jgi:hypothetical protein
VNINLIGLASFGTGSQATNILTTMDSSRSKFQDSAFLKYLFNFATAIVFSSGYRAKYIGEKIYIGDNFRICM